MNHFDADLAYSHDRSDEPRWESVYREAFPGFTAMIDLRGDGWWQRAGIDRRVCLRDSTTLTVDEKVRRIDYQQDDILLEYYSNWERRTPGWVAKDLACDYIAYAIVPSETCYLLPVKQLRRAWQVNRHEWVGAGKASADGFRFVSASNPGYHTHSVCVPRRVLMDAIRDALIINWAKEKA